MPADGTTQFEGLVKTSLFTIHQQLGAKMVEFAGWAMPLEYQGTLVEHEAVRKSVGVFDVSHLGAIWITGEEAEAAVAATFTNDPAELAPSQSQYTLCCEENGGVVDDLIIYRIAPDHFLAVPNAANTPAVFAALSEAAEKHGATVQDDSRRLAMLAVQGSRALDLVDRLFPDVLPHVDYHGIGEIHLGPGDTGWLCRTGYTGEPGVELVLPGLDAPGIFRELIELGAVPCGLGARDTLRLEMGYPLHGHELTRETDPFEAGLGWAVKLDRGEFRGRGSLRARREQGPRRRLAGLRARDRGIPRAGMAVHRDGQVVGTVTSGTFSPTLRAGIGLAYLVPGVETGDSVSVDVRGREHAFDVVEPPFVDRDPRS